MNKKEFEKELDMKLASLKEEMMQKFEEQEDEFPKIGDKYWYVGSNGEIYCDTWDGSPMDKDRFAIGNIKTEEEAEFESERLKVIAELEKYAEPKDRKWDLERHHYYILYDYGMNRIEYFHHSILKGIDIYFESLEKAKEAVEKVGQDRVRRFYLGVED